MLQSPVRKFLIGASLTCGSLCCVALISAPISAETLEELDALSDLSVNEVTGIAAAREQAGQNQYLEALATLERVLAVNPKSRDARLIHALYLCKIDDQQGGMVEIDDLKKKHYGKELLQDARARCALGGEG